MTSSEGGSVAPGRPAPAIPEESAEDLYDDAPCGYLSTLEDGTIVRVNRTFLRWTGYTRDEMEGRVRFQDLLTAGGRIFHETHYRPMLQMQGAVREIAVEIKTASGGVIPALINSTLRRDDDGVPPVVRTTIFDATERRRYEEELLRERKRAQESETRARELAAILQESLIPPEPSAIPGLDVAAEYRPAGEGDIVGGDFYDVFETRLGDWVAVVGDVSGKGVEAARVTAAARYTLRATAMRSTKPRVLLTTLNEALLSQGLDRGCTAVYARITRPDGAVRMTVASAGHPLPLRLRPDGSVETIGVPGTLLGALEEIHVADVDLDLQPGDAVVFYTDGVTEARAPDGAFFGEDRLAALVGRQAGEPSAGICRAIVEEALAYQDGRPRDDIAVLVLRRPG